MTAPVQVAGHIPTSNRVLRIIGWLGFALGIVLFAANLTVGVFTTVGFGIVVFGTELFRISRIAKLCTVTDTGKGFLIEDRHGTRTVDDGQVLSVSLRSKNHYSEGLLKSRTRVFTVKVLDAPAPITMTNRIKTDEVDPLGALVERTINGYQARAQEALSHGASVRGEGWSFDKASLSVEHPHALRVPIEEINAIDVFDRKIKVWRTGSDETFLEIDVDADNAFLLHLLLSPIVAERDASGDVTDGLGRVLFERPTPTAVRVTLWIMAAVALLMGSLIFAGQMLGVVIGVLSICAGALLIYVACRLPRSVFRCHQYGVYKKSLFGECQLSYDAVEEFTYAATRQYYNGAYTGTSLSVRFEPAAGKDARPISFSRTVHAVDEALDDLRDYISQIIAARMLPRIAEGGTVPWTSHVQFTADGIRYRPSGFVGRKEPVLLEYGSVHGFEIEQGTFHLWEKGRDKSVLTISVSEPNFFPGFMCLVTIFSDDDASHAD